MPEQQKSDIETKKLGSTKLYRQGREIMKLEYTITDQILLTWGTGDSRTVLRVWHISHKAEAEAELKRIVETEGRVQ